MSVDAAALEMLHDHLQRGVAMVAEAGRPGWLLRMATHEHSFDEFVGVHNSILAILQVPALCFQAASFSLLSSGSAGTFMR